MNKKLFKRITKAIGFALLITFLAGCVKLDPKTGSPTGEGWVYKLIAAPTIKFLDWAAVYFGGNYGWPLVVVSAVVPLLMVPSQIKQIKSSMTMQHRTKFAQPEIDAIQEDLQHATTEAEQQKLQAELMDVYKKYDIKMTDSLSGCLPLLIQLPIISAVHAVVRSSKEIANSTFFGVHLGSRSWSITILVAVLAFLQSWLSQRSLQTSSKDGEENEQATQVAAQSKIMMFMSPLMIGWLTYTSSAGLGVYFLVSYTINLLTQVYINFKLRPNLEVELAKADEKYLDIQRRTPKRPKRKAQTASAEPGRLVPTKRNVSSDKGSKSGRRNEGIQQRRNKK